MNTIKFEKDQVIFRQGEYPYFMYDILSGKVGIYSDYETENEKLITELDAGQLLGEMGLIEVYPRSATAVALEDGTALAEISDAELTEYFKDKPEKLLAIMRQLSARIRETTQKLVDVCHTIYENDESEKNGGDVSPWVREQMEYYYNMYRDLSSFY